MTIQVDPKIQEQFDLNAAEHRTATARIGEELATRQRDVAEQVAANKAALAAIGKEILEAGERTGPRVSAQRLEENDISARAEDYQEPDEEVSPVPPVPAPAPRPARAEDEVPSFQWDDDPKPSPPAPKRAPARPPLREPEEDLSDHDWLE